MSRFDQDVDMFYDVTTSEMEHKKQILKEAMWLSEEAVKEAGCDLADFVPWKEIAHYIGTPLDELAAGYFFGILASDDNEMVIIHTKMTDGGQFGISATLMRMDNASGRPAACIDGNWTSHFLYEGEDIAPSNCETCEKREECQEYQSRLAGEFMENGAAKILDNADPDLQSILLSEDAESQFLSLYLIMHPDTTLEQWEKKREEISLLIDLKEECYTLLAPGFVEDEEHFALYHDDDKHTGFCIRQKGEELELCQCINSNLLSAALDDLVVIPDIYIRPVTTGDIDDMSDFAERYLDKYSGEGLYTVPFSLNGVVTLRGPIADEVGHVRKYMVSEALKLGKDKKTMAMDWVTAFGALVHKARQSLQD